MYLVCEQGRAGKRSDSSVIVALHPPPGKSVGVTSATKVFPHAAMRCLMEAYESTREQVNEWHGTQYVVGYTGMVYRDRQCGAVDCRIAWDDAPC